MTLKQPNKLTSNYLEELKKQIQRFEYEQVVPPMPPSQQGKKKIQPKEVWQPPVKRTPTYRVYESHKRETILLSPELFAVMAKEEEAMAHERVAEWVALGDHPHIQMAVKAEMGPTGLAIAVEKGSYKTLRDLMGVGFFMSESKKENSEKVLNVMLQVGSGLHYMHTMNFLCQDLRPENILVEHEKLYKIGNLFQFYGVGSQKHMFAGGSAEYWSVEMGNVFDMLKDRGKESGGYKQAVQLMPSLTERSDVYQFGLLALQFLYGRFWLRGDRIPFSQLEEKESNFFEQEVADYLHEMGCMCLSFKQEERPEMKQIVNNLLTLIQELYPDPKFLLWAGFFDEAVAKSESLNNRAVGMLLTSNQNDAEREWAASLLACPRNLTAAFNFAHFRRMRKNIDQMKLNKELYLLPQSRKRNYYLLISNLVFLPILRDPFRTFNFNPKLCKGKEVPIVQRIIAELGKLPPKPKHYSHCKKYQLPEFKFQACKVAKNHFFAKLQRQFAIYVQSLQDLHPSKRTYRILKCKRVEQTYGDRFSHLTSDQNGNFLLLVINQYLVVYKLNQIVDAEIYIQQTEPVNFVGACFDAPGNWLALGTAQGNIRVFSLASREMTRELPLGPKVLPAQLYFHDRSTAIGFSSDKSVNFYRVESQKPIFSLKCQNTIVSYHLAQISANTQVLIAQTTASFQVWNLKDRVLLKNMEIEEPLGIRAFSMGRQKRVVLHFNNKLARLWNYSNGLILRSFKPTNDIVWVDLLDDGRRVVLLTRDNRLIFRNVDFEDFTRNFQSLCVPDELCISDSVFQTSEETTTYLQIMKSLLANLKLYNESTHERRNSLENMYRLGELLKTDAFFQEYDEAKTVLTHLSKLKISESKGTRVNAFSEQFIFAGRKESHLIVAVSYSPQVKQLALAEIQGQIRVLSVTNWVCVRTHKPLSEKPLSVLLSHSLLFSYENKSCYKVDLKTGVEFHVDSPITPLFLLNPQEDHMLIFSETGLAYYRERDWFKLTNVFSNLAAVQLLTRREFVTLSRQQLRLWRIGEGTITKVGLFRVGGSWLSLANERLYTLHENAIYLFQDPEKRLTWQGLHSIDMGQKINYLDLPPQVVEKGQLGRTADGFCLLVVDGCEVVVVDMDRRQLKWRIEMLEEVLGAWWLQYPHSIVIATLLDVRILAVYWKFQGKK